MQNNFNRRKFVKIMSITGAGIGLGGFRSSASGTRNMAAKKAGIIGLDTSHAVAFVKSLNAANPDADFKGYRVVAAYPKGSNDIKSSYDRIPGYTEEVKKLGVEIVGSIDELLKKVDVVFLETNDGRLHLQQALPVLKAKKPLFVDKPVAASYKDAKAIFDAAEKWGTPVFSSSSLRYITGMSDVLSGKISKVTGADVFSPAKLESTHPDLFWYGIHGVEMLFTAMGTGCKTVSRTNNQGNDLVVGVWDDGRIGSFRGIRTGKDGYGGTIFGEKGIITLSSFKGYDPLLKQIINFFETGTPPVNKQETLEIVAFMEAAEISKRLNGKPVALADILNSKK
ncbi:MAG: dehydrogenase [Sphingobacteriales bacterium 41-5]|nr:MAG: dehydrogenase [Sphingobacteriales bacterium 41-5]